MKTSLATRCSPRYGVALLALVSMATAGAAELGDSPLTLKSDSLIELCKRAAEDRPLQDSACERNLTRADLSPEERRRGHALMAVAYAAAADRVAAQRHLAAAAPAVNDWQVQGNVGLTQLYLGDYADAATTIARAIELASGAEPALHLNYSLALRALGRFDAAALEYARYEEANRLAASMIPPNPRVR